MMKCIAIDDEPLALDLLVDNIKKISFLELCGRFQNINEAISFLATNNVDLLFLDIRMPEIDGISFLKSISQKPLTIFVTAFDNYAIQGFDLDIVDYVMKPVSFERFLKASTKAYDVFLKSKHYSLDNESISSGQTLLSKFIFVKSEHKIIKLAVDEIKYIESLKDYVKIHTGGKPIMAILSLKYLEEVLPKNIFVRIHRSYIISLIHIDYVARSKVLIGDASIPISLAYRDDFFKLFLDKKKGI